MGTKRLVWAGVGGLLLFLLGMGAGALVSQPAEGEWWCVVSVESAHDRKQAPGALVPESDPGSGCDPGEVEVCGTFQGAGEDRSFGPRACPGR